jgi:hypothetical protein
MEISNNFILIILILFFLYFSWQINYLKNEHFSASISDNINKIYQADIQSIRNLSSIATSLQTGGVTVPGNLTISDNLTTKSLTTSDGNLNVNNDYTITSNTDLRITSALGKTLYLNNDKTSGDVHFNAGSPNSNIIIDNGKLVTPSLEISGAGGIVGKGTSGSDRLVRIWDNLSVNNNLNVNTVNTGSLNIANSGGNITGINGNAINIPGIIVAPNGIQTSSINIGDYTIKQENDTGDKCGKAGTPLLTIRHKNGYGMILGSNGLISVNTAWKVQEVRC